MDKKIKFFEKYKIQITFIKEFLNLIILYGFVINFMLWSVFGIKFTFFSFLGYGILIYLIKVEFPSLINKLFPRIR
jgi:hypothetical protein